MDLKFFGSTLIASLRPKIIDQAAEPTQILPRNRKIYRCKVHKILTKPDFPQIWGKMAPKSDHRKTSKVGLHSNNVSRCKIYPSTPFFTTEWCKDIIAVIVNGHHNFIQFNSIFFLLQVILPIANSHVVDYLP